MNSWTRATVTPSVWDCAVDVDVVFCQLSLRLVLSERDQFELVWPMNPSRVVLGQQLEGAGEELQLVVDPIGATDHVDVRGQGAYLARRRQTIAVHVVHAPQDPQAGHDAAERHHISHPHENSHAFR
jgi:hypothetical protein